jgi:RCC1 and BTB domain-containing protein
MECSLSAGDYHTAVVRADGALFTCGSNRFGQLGRGGEQGDMAVLGRVLPSRYLLAVSAGNKYTAAIASAGELFTWGCGGSGRLGHGDAEDRPFPTEVQGEVSGKRVVAVAAGSHHTAAVTESGELYVWGVGIACGQLRNDDVRCSVSKSLPSPLVTFTRRY